MCSLFYSLTSSWESFDATMTESVMTESLLDLSESLIDDFDLFSSSISSMPAQLTLLFSKGKACLSCTLLAWLRSSFFLYSSELILWFLKLESEADDSSLGPNLLFLL